MDFSLYNLPQEVCRQGKTQNQYISTSDSYLRHVFREIKTF